MSDRRRPAGPIHPLAAVPTIESELFTLSGRLCDQVASDADCRRLEALLTDPAQPDAIAVYCAVLEVHSSLHWRWHAGSRGPWLPGGRVASPPVSPQPPQPPRAVAGASGPRPRAVQSARATETSGDTALASPRGSVIGQLIDWFQGLGKTAALAVFFQVAIVLCAVALAVVGQAWQGVPSSVAQDGPARIVGAEEALWSTDTGDLVVGDTLAAGRQLRLTRGLVEIACGPAATVVLEGPATFTLASRKSLALDRGRAAVTVHEAGKDGFAGQPAFVVQTPSATVSDRGTRFGVAVEPTGQTDVHVFEGAVECGGRSLLGPWFDGWLGAWSGAGPARLAAGEAAAIDSRGSVSRLPQAVPRQFARALPPRDALAWNASKATTIYRDPLVAAGLLGGTQPAGRGGRGDARWSAPPADWTLTAAGLEARAPGSCSLPFEPVAGRVYRLAVELTVSAGGSDWAAIGFSGPPDPRSPVLTCGWMLQRHSTELDPNGLFVGADEASLRFTNGDRKTGRRSFVILLDTRPTRWTVTFLADGQRLETEQLPPAARIESIGLSTFGSAQVLFSSF